MNSNQSEVFLFARRRRILQLVAIAIGVIGLISTTYTTFGLIDLLSKNQTASSSLISEATSVSTIILALVAYLLGRGTKPQSVRQGAYLVTGCWSLVILSSLVLSSFNTLTAAALMLPLLCAGMLFGPKEVLGWIGLLIGLLTVAFILAIMHVVPNGDGSSDTTIYTAYVFFSLMLLFNGGAFWYLQVNIGKVLGEVHSQLAELTKFNEERERKRRAGEEVSLYLNSMTAQLSQVTLEQSGRSQQQASAVVEITTSINELGETSRQIAANSEQVAQSADYGLQSAHRVREVSLRANTTAGRGQNAVGSSIQSIEEVRQGITNLAERLMVLTNCSGQIVSIVGLIREIADETHLLALNAAIESAGSSQQSQRFGVVAAEVKSLADRTLEATTEVEQVIGELQGAVAAAVLASEETRKKTFGAVERSYQAGEVIGELGQVVDEAALKAVEILEVVQKVFNLSEEISLATRQQDSAVRQIISTMEDIGLVAKENASAVLQITATVTQIDNLSTQLKEVLNSNQQVVSLELSAA